MNSKTEKRKAKGKCLYCGNPAEEGRVSCASCAAKRKEQRDEYRENGLCSRCGGAVLGKNTLCEFHRNKAMWYEFKRRHKKKEGLVLDGKKASADIVAELQAEAYSLKEAPTLKIISIGEDEPSKVYIRNKRRCARKSE